jgi:hypothetical protein
LHFVMVFITLLSATIKINALWKCGCQCENPNISSSIISFKVCQCTVIISLLFSQHFLRLQRFDWLYVIFCVTLLPRDSKLRPFFLSEFYYDVFMPILIFPGNSTPRTGRTARWRISVRS